VYFVLQTQILCIEFLDAIPSTMQLKLALLLASLVPRTASQGTGHWLFKNDVTRNDVILNEFLLFETSSVSDVGCARLCGLTPNCVTFTFTERTLGSRSCRGHSRRTDSMTSQPGTLMYDRNDVTTAGMFRRLCHQMRNVGMIQKEAVFTTVF
jgi:hypothetical protein